MSLSRRGFFGMLAGLAACPLFGLKSLYAGPIPGHNYVFHYKNFICDDVVSPKNSIDPKNYDDYCRVFTWKHEPGILWWSKESHD
jgi:hypothetical protein